MADFSIPFAQNGERRTPTSDEKENGFPCGPLDKELFNGLIHGLQAEVGTVVDQAGITPTDLTNDRLYLAIMALIEAATGGGDVESYLTIAQARARLPIFPDVDTTDGTFGMTSPGTGQVRLPAGVIFRHRGIYPVTTVLTDFATAVSKTYHVRWNQADGFTLNDLADVSYNPLVALETSPVFDSTYDNILVARVVTNSSNVPTITNLSNKVRLSNQTVWRGTMNNSLSWATRASTAVVLNWARSPIIADLAMSEWRSDNAGPSGVATSIPAGAAKAVGVRIPAAGVTRYAFPDFEYYYEDNQLNNGIASVVITALAV